MTTFSIADFIDEIYVINLPFRTDRRAEIAAQLSRLGLGFDHPKIQLFEAVRPDNAGEFPSIGARGCFMSHLAVLRAAIANGAKSALILEDDADFTSEMINLSAKELANVIVQPWEILYLGYSIDDQNLEATGLTQLIAPSLPVRQTHAMIIREQALSRIADYLEKMASRSRGDKAGGPMHVDGAYSWFRRENPDIAAAIVTSPWAVQRASATDIHGQSLKDRLPFVKIIRRLRNRLRG